MNIITLTTDFGERDYSVGAIKGALYSKCSDIRIVDISHLVAPYDIFQAAYILDRAYKHFPKKSIHIIGVDAVKTPQQRQLIMKYNDHYFIGADNGILSFISEGDTSSIELVEIENQTEPCPFPTLNTLVPIAIALAQGEDFKSLGRVTHHPLKDVIDMSINIDYNKNVIEGSVIYIDHYGNVITNISRKIFEQVRQGRNFTVYIGGRSFNKIYNSYDEFIVDSTEENKITNEENKITNEENKITNEGKALLLFNCTDNIELAIYKSNMNTIGGASTLLGIQYRDQISIFFK